MLKAYACQFCGSVHGAGIVRCLYDSDYRHKGDKSGNGEADYEFEFLRLIHIALLYMNSRIELVIQKIHDKVA